MSGRLVKFDCSVNEFTRAVNDTIGITVHSRDEAFETQGRLLCGELIQRTPPFSGKTIKKMIDARGVILTDTDIQDLSALAVGKRRVEKDIRKVIFGVKNPTAPPAPQVFMGQNSRTSRSVENLTDWGKFQRCEGRDAIRVFATKSGEVYGVDYMQFAASASVDDLQRTHEEHRTKRGRVTMAGLRDRIVGRWRWLNLLTTKEEILKPYIIKAQEGVGEGRGGWVDGLIRLGGKLSPRGWVGKHRKSGYCQAHFGRDNVSIVIVNQSRWASGGDPDRIIQASMAGRVKAIIGSINKALNKAWNRR